MPKRGGGKRTSDVEIDENAEFFFAGAGEASSAGASSGTLPRDFKALMLRDEVVRGLEQAGYEKPSPVQARAIPLGKFGADLVIQAKSGTGKTCVFAVIALESISLDFRAPQVIIIAPTRELAHQTRDVIRSIGQYMPGLECHAFVGGMSTDLDIKALSLETAACHIVSGTPGRLRSLIEMGSLRLEGVRHLVLDEVDQLLAEGFRQQVEYFLGVLPTRRQVLAVSATFTKELLSYLDTIMHKPHMVSVVKDSVALKGVRQFFFDVHPPDTASNLGTEIGSSQRASGKSTGAGGSSYGRDKFKSRMQGLVQVLETTPFHQCVVFTNSRILGQRVAQLLVQLGFPAQFVCGDMPQAQRLAAIAQLRAFELRVLVSSDLTARGIDVVRQFTCFTRTKVQILTRNALLGARQPRCQSRDAAFLRHVPPQSGSDRFSFLVFFSSSYCYVSSFYYVSVCRPPTTRTCTEWCG
jgi:ATP-dependent RNA helicase DDX20